MSKKTEKSTASRKGTRGAQGAGNIRQRKDGTWEARYTLGRDPGTGKQVQKSVYGKTQKEVRQKLQKICQAIDDDCYSEPSKMNLDEWLDIWIDVYTGDVKPSTKQTYSDQIKNHIKPAVGKVRLNELKPHTLQTFYIDLSRGNGSKKPLSAKTVKNIHGVLHRALQQAVEIDYMVSNPATKCKLPRVTKPDLMVLPQERMSDFLKSQPKDVYGDLFFVALFTGMREGELLGLTWDCIDFKHHTIYIRKQLQRNRERKEYALVSLKNDKPRKIMPAPSVMERLKQRRTKQLRYALNAGSAWCNELNLVFTNEIGENLVPRTVVKKFKNIATEIGLPRLRVHDLRHSYAVNSLMAGDNIKTVQENLGHHTAAFTLDVYGFVTDGMRQDSADRMEAFIMNSQKSKE